MERNKKEFVDGNVNNITSNARLWGFNEITDGDFCNYETMKVENEDKIMRLSKLRNPEFNQLFDFYSKMIKLRGANG